MHFNESQPTETLMNWSTVESQWREVAGSAREQWRELTDEEVQQVSGKRERLEELLKQKYGLSQHEAVTQVNDWANRLTRAAKP